MRFLSPYFLQGISHSLTKNTGRGLSFSVDCRAATNSASLFPSCKRVVQTRCAVERLKSMNQKRKAGVRTLAVPKSVLGKLRITKIQGALYSLFHYTNVKAFASMVKGKSIWLSRIDQMNDGTEVFPDANRTYAFCMTAVPTENAGMWIAYGLPRKDAIRVRFSGKAIHDICTANKGKVEVVPVKDGHPTAEKVAGTASLQYVGYVSRAGKRVHVRNCVYQFKDTTDLSSASVMSECGSFIKLLGWQYEHEVRLVIRLEKAIDAEKVQLDFSDVIDKLLTYNPQKRNGSMGMPSVIAGPWSNCSSFKDAFQSCLHSEGSKTKESVGYLLKESSGLVRKSEFERKIRLGHCTGCKRLESCKCLYCEEC